MELANKTYTKYQSPKNIQWKDGTFPYSSLSDSKFTIKLDDNNLIEAAVFDLIVNENTREKHACISIQAGCKFGCKMCSSGKKGFSRNLTPDEILDQIQLISVAVHKKTFESLGFMGIGEPCDNLDNFLEAIHLLVETNPEYIKNISFSTICLPDKIIKISKAIKSNFIPPFNMVWISLHASIDQKRHNLMPFTKNISSQEVIDTARHFALNHPETTVWINYMLFKGFNDSRNDAKILAKLLQNSNILPIMLTEPNNNYLHYPKGKKTDLERFSSYLKHNNVQNKITYFASAGSNINAGCGEFIFTPR